MCLSGSQWKVVSVGYWRTKTVALSAAPSERSAACCLNDKDDKEDIYSACTAQLHAGSSRVELRLRSRVLAAVTLLTLCKYCNHKGSKNTGGFGCHIHSFIFLNWCCRVLRTNRRKIMLILCIWAVSWVPKTVVRSDISSVYTAHSAPSGGKFLCWR